MPTDLGAASERKRKATQAEARIDKMILLIFGFVALAMALLLILH